MDFDFDDDQEMLRATLRRLLEDRSPLGTVREHLGRPDSFDREVWKAGTSMGWTSMLVPEVHGGGSLSGQGLIDLVVLSEEIGRSLYGGPVASVNVVAHALAASGEERHLARLRTIVSGERICTWAFDEPDGEWMAADISTAAVRTHGGIEVTGRKRFVEGAQVADDFLVTALLDGLLAQLIVPAGAPGVTCRYLDTLDQSRSWFSVEFDSVSLVDADLVGPVGVADEIETQLQIAKVLLCAETVGAARRVVEFTTQYAKDRVQFDQPIGSFQAIKHKLTDMFVALETAEALTHYAALALDGGFENAAEAVSMAKAYVGEQCSTLASEALQVHGGIGFTWEHDLHLYIRRIKANEMLFGTPFTERESYFPGLVGRLDHAAGSGVLR